MSTMYHANKKMDILLACCVLAAIQIIQPIGAQDSGESDYDESSCDNEHFYCDFDDPSMFYRCIDGVFHSFKCPTGLHFR